MKKLLILILAASTAMAAGHRWTKMSETEVENEWGQSVVQCVWECDYYATDHGRHTTVTQGAAFCPNP